MLRRTKLAAIATLAAIALFEGGMLGSSPSVAAADATGPTCSNKACLLRFQECVFALGYNCQPIGAKATDDDGLSAKATDGAEMQCNSNPC